MTALLVKWFVKNNEEVEKIAVRTAYGVLASVVGIICNLVLFAIKLTIGLLLNSISVTADAFNNLSDAGSSVISFLGVKLASKPADEDHPFGHGRIEYIAALIVSFLVLQVGFTFFKEAIGKIREPELLKFQLVSVIILLLSVGIKLWLSMFNKSLGKRINSKVMKAVAADAMGDVLTTMATVFSIVFVGITGINIDGIVGLVVSLVVMWAGIGIARDTLEPLIGEAIDPEVYNEIKDFVEKYDGVVGSHDLIVHNYGPGRSMASIHVEVPNDVGIEISHEIIDQIERDANEYLGIFLVIHMDPIEMKDEQVLEVKEMVEKVVKSIDSTIGIHDFRLVTGKEHMNIIFDVEIPHEYNEEKEEELRLKIVKEMQKKDQKYQCVITMDKSFIGET